MVQFSQMVHAPFHTPLTSMIVGEKSNIVFNLLTGYDEIFRQQDIYSLYLKTSGKNTSGILVLVHIFFPANPIKLSSLFFFPCMFMCYNEY